MSKGGVYKKAFRLRRGFDHSPGCIASTLPDWLIGKAVSEAISAHRKKKIHLSTAPLHDQRGYVSRLVLSCNGEVVTGTILGMTDSL